MQKKKLKDYEKGSLGTGSDALHNPFNIKPVGKTIWAFITGLVWKVASLKCTAGPAGPLLPLDLSHFAEVDITPVQCIFTRTFYFLDPLRITLRINRKNVLFESQYGAAQSLMWGLSRTSHAVQIRMTGRTILGPHLIRDIFRSLEAAALRCYSTSLFWMSENVRRGKGLNGSPNFLHS